MASCCLLFLWSLALLQILASLFLEPCCISDCFPGLLPPEPEDDIVGVLGSSTELKAHSIVFPDGAGFQISTSHMCQELSAAALAAAPAHMGLVKASWLSPQ